MSEILTIVPPVFRDQRLMSFKAQLINAVAPELHKMSLEHQTRTNVRELLQKTAARYNIGEMPQNIRDALLDSALADLVGYGPLEWLLADTEVSEIMVNGSQLVFVEKQGMLYETDVKFENDEQVMRIIDRILLPLGRRVDYERPTADARLPDGSRVNVIIPPVAVDGPTLTIRKFSQTKMTIDDLVALGTITSYMAKFLEACVVARMNILISGNTSAGKTTILNILSSFIPNDERIVTIEDAVELQMKQRHVIRLETKLANTDGVGEVSIRDLVRNALRMRPDRLVVGEVRGGETLDMLQAMNTGHSGSLTTLHANTPRDAIARIETMALMSGLELPIMAIRKQIASALDLIVHLGRLQDGTRKATQITEVVGMESDIVTLMDIYKFTQTGISTDGKVQGELRPTGIRPQFNQKLEVAGYKLGGEYFGAGL